MYIPSFKLISQSMLKKSPENADGRTDRRTGGRTLPRHNTSRFLNGRITKCVFIVCKVKGMSTMWHLHNRPATFSWLRPASKMRNCNLASSGPLGPRSYTACWTGFATTSSAWISWSSTKLDWELDWMSWSWKSITQVANWKQGKSEGFDSCDQPTNLIQIGFKSSIFQTMWPWIWWMTSKNNRAPLL